MVSLLLCAFLVVRQCAGLLSSHLFCYAEQRATQHEKLSRGVHMPASVKEAAIEKVTSGEFATLERALENMGYAPHIPGQHFYSCKCNTSQIP